MGSVHLIVICNTPHGAVVTHIVAAVHQRKNLNGTAVEILGYVILFIRVIGMRPVTVIDGSQAVHEWMSATRVFCDVMVNDVINAASLSIVGIDLG